MAGEEGWGPATDEPAPWAAKGTANALLLPPPPSPIAAGESRALNRVGTGGAVSIDFLALNVACSCC